MIRYDTNTLAQYLERLAAREPVPGGGSVAALSGALGAGLIEMVTRYSQGKGKPVAVETEFAAILTKAGAGRLKLLELVSLDSEAYLNMREAKKQSPEAYQAAMKKAADIPLETKTLCQELLKLTPFLRKEGNQYLVSDVTAAEEFLKAGMNAANAMIETNT